MESLPIDPLADEPTPEKIGRARREQFEILGAILLGMFLAALDRRSSPGPARIVRSSRVPDYYTWVVTISSWTSNDHRADLRKLSDLYGRNRC